MKQQKFNLFILLLIMFSACNSLKNTYETDIRTDLEKFPPKKTDIFTEANITLLPEPVQRYIRYCGYLGTEKMSNVCIEWKDVNLKMAPNKKWTEIKCYQYNSVSEPTRIVYMKSRIMGLFSFEGRDKYQNGQGNMHIKLLKRFTVANALGKEMNRSGMVTVLAEALFVPSYILNTYITWQSIDSNSAKATLSFNGESVSGIFYFNDIGEMIFFTSNDRYMSEKDGSYSNIPWSVEVSDYNEINGIKIPGFVKAMWNFKKGSFKYFKGRITNIEYNVNTVK